jgi:hypothetical protein
VTPTPTTPFRGTQPFEPTKEDRDRFFGRDREIEALVSLVFSQRMVLVYAQSGAGKTSLWNAGVTPTLQDRGFEVLPVTRPGGEVPEDIHKDSVANAYVLRALLALDREADATSLAQATLPGFLADLPRERNRLGPVPRVLAVDQFEELFGDRSEQGLALQRGFFGQLLAALDRDDLLRVVLLMREEFLAELDGVAENALPARFRLERLDPEAALEAVVKPVERAGRRFAEGAATALVEKLRMVRAPGPSWTESGRCAACTSSPCSCRRCAPGCGRTCPATGT